ncbi:MAG: DNA-3-methyladenine glycosylase 2 family protein [Rubrivivax sp.]|nr:MAG: DNA-3-methyladenine glycosylase 2 family protein [Rubrivivax sp.]
MHPEILPPDAAYAVLQAHDMRFDGRLFVGVTSTGVYCRPVCRVRLPRRENCRFFATAAQAEAERFRPCMKCRPELAPRPLAWTTMDASRTLAQQAAAWLDTCDDPEASVEDLARHVGITSRHLRRIFQAEHGVSPLQYLQTRRLLLAKALLTDSTLPVQEVAHAAGFASLRRFNAAFIEHYRLQPTALRREGGSNVPASRLRLGYREPYDVAGVLAFLAPRAIAGIERVEEGAVTRTIALTHAGQRHAGWLRVRFERAGQVAVDLSPALWPAVGKPARCCHLLAAAPWAAGDSAR